jgi:mannose-6-phosphate isomerase-like protein (cupin superfamily)
MAENGATPDRVSVQSGDEISNPRTGQRMVFRRTADDSDGRELIIECWSPPEAPGASREPLHVHPEQEKRFRIIDGELTVEMDGAVRTMRAGEEIVVPNDAFHSFWNASDAEVHYWQEFRPALRSAEFFTTLFALARDGEVDERGMPGLLQISLSMPRFRREIVVAKPPAWMQRLVGVVGPVARMRGLRAERR